jgi:hypothetical protein
MSTTARRRGRLLVALLTALAFALPLAATSPASAIYGTKMENKGRGFLAGPACLEIDYARAYSGAAATVDWCSNYGNNMQWIPLPAADGSGFVRLQVVHSGQCLDVKDGAYTDGAQIVQMPCSSSSSQQWKFVKMSWADDQNFYEVVARHSGKCLDKSGWNVVQWNCHGADWQQWTRP